MQRSTRVHGQQQQQQQSQQFTFENLKDIFTKNKFQSECVPQIQIEQHVSDRDNAVKEEEGWIRRPLGPGGPMALVLRVKNYLYRTATQPLQKGILREAITDAQNDAVEVLKGRRWPARRVSEALSSCLGYKIPEDAKSAWNDLCYAVVCELGEIQIMILDPEHKVLAFAPEDLRLWKRNVPIYAMSMDGRWIFCGGDEDESWNPSMLGAWISKMSDAGWKIDWPMAEGTMESMREVLEDAGVPVEGRLKKDELARRAGKTAAIRILADWTRAVDFLD